MQNELEHMVNFGCILTDGNVKHTVVVVAPDMSADQNKRMAYCIAALQHAAASMFSVI